MTTVKLRYTVKRRGRLFWQPTPEMRDLGFLPKPLGEEGPAAQGEAIRLYQAWLKAAAEIERVTDYPPGTFGSYWDQLRGSHRRPSMWWTAKATRTREDYERAWVYIDAWRPTDKMGKPTGPTLSRTGIGHITTELCEQFLDHLNRTVSERERWRAIKGLKILLADAAVRLRLGYASPADKLVNHQPHGRSAIWLGAEIPVLAVGAKALGFEGISIGLKLLWETMFSPVDVRTLRPSQIKKDGQGYYVEGDRAKTGKETFAALSDELAAEVLAYLAAQERNEADDTPIIRQRDGHFYRTKDTFGGDFRDVRNLIIPGDTRQLLDIRRSANVEADAAGADKKTMGELLANGLANSRFLDETYTPPTVTKAREVALQRIQGRAKLAGEVMRVRSKSS